MVQIPEALAQSIKAGDCVLWLGAGFGALAGRPGWDTLLGRLVDGCPENARSGLHELLAQGRLRTVLTYVHRHLGDEPLGDLLEQVSAEAATQLADGAERLTELPWKACFATVYSDVVQRIFSTAERSPEVLSHRNVHYLSLRDQREFFILRTPPTGRAMRADGVLYELVEEVVRTRTILFMGFEPDDPDLLQIHDLMDRIGRGKRHFALMPLVSAPEAEEILDRFAIEVIDVAEDVSPTALVAELASAVEDSAPRPSLADDDLALLDVTRAVRKLAWRVDLAMDDALTLDIRWFEQLVDALPDNLATVPPSTLLRTGNMLLAHAQGGRVAGRLERARKCHQHVAAGGSGWEFTNLARFNLAFAAAFEGDLTTAFESFVACAETDRSLALVPPRLELLAVKSASATQLSLHCRDRESKEELEVAVATLARPVGGQEQAAFHKGIAALREVEHSSVQKALGGFADGHLFGVMSSPVPGFVLADTIDDKPMSLSKALELYGPLSQGLDACHARGVLHRNLNPRNIVIGAKGPVLRGFGFPPVIGFMRPAVREENDGYMAPEAWAGEPVSASADAYALAAVLYHCLTGAPPRGAAPSPTSLRDELDPRIDPLLQGALHPDPAKRLPCKEVRTQLEHIVATPELGEAQRRQRASVGSSKELAPEAAFAQAGGPGEVLAATGVAAPGTVQEAISAPVSVKIVLPEDPEDLESWAWILERKPMHLEAREAIARIEQNGREQGRWDRVAEVLGVKAQHAQVQQDRVGVLRELVDLFENKLGAPANAFTSLQTLIEEVSVSEQLELTDELARLAEITGDWSALADSLLIVAERATDAASQARLYTDLARVYAEKLGAADRAIVSYEKANEIEPTSERLQALVPHYRKLGRHPDLATALLSLADLQEGEDRRSSLLGGAKVLREELGDEEGAYGVVEILLADLPNDPEALEMAESLTRSLERWDALVDILGRRADGSLDPSEAAPLRREAAQLAIEHLADGASAIDELSKLVDADRSDKVAAQQLVDLLRRTVEQDVSRRPALIDALAVLIELVEVPEERATLLAECAGLLDRESDGRDRAADCRERILETLPPDHTLARSAADELERHYRRQEAWPRLSEMLIRQGTAKDAEEEFRARAWEKVLELRRGSLADDEGVIEALESLTALEPTATKWRDELLERYLERKEFEKAGPLIRAQVFEEQDPRRKAELLIRGGILREQIGKIEGAFEALEEAVSLVPTMVEAWLALRDVYDQHEQPLKALNAQVSAGEHHSNRVERVKLLFGAAKRYLEEVDRPERGMELLEKVVELDPDHREATAMLLEHLVEAGELSRAWPHAQTYVLQVKSQAAHDSALNLRAYSVAGRCALAVEEKDRARDYLEKAKAVDATNLDVLRLLGDLDMEAERWEEALRNYQSVVLGVGDKLGPADLSRLYVRMAEARGKMGEAPKAMQMLERAFDIDPDNESAIETMIRLAPDGGGASVLVKGKQRLAALLERREQRVEQEQEKAALHQRRIGVLREVAEAQLTELELPDDAIGTLESLLAILPEDPAVLHRMLDIFTQQMRWSDAVGVLGRLAEAQTTDAARAKYLYAGASILREYLLDEKGASDWLERTLIADPMHDKAFGIRIEQLEEKHEWREVSRVLRARLKALAKVDPGQQHVDLFAKLGETYENMRDGKTALAAYDQAARLSAKLGEDEGTNKERRLKVMRLAVQIGADSLDKAIDHGHALIAANPMELETYHRLVELYLKQGARDRARALSRTLKFLKQADEAELELVDAGGGPGQVHRALSRENWRHGVYHPLEDPRLSDLFSLIWPMVAAREGRTHAHHQVARPDRVEVTLQSPNALARFLAHACQIFDAPVPDLFMREDELGGIVIDALADKKSGDEKTVFPSVLVGRTAVADTSETSMKFRTGRAIARVRPDHILGSVLASATALRHAVFGAIRVADPAAEIPMDVESAAAGYAAAIERYMQPSRLEQLKSLAQRVHEHEIDCRAWVQGVTYTATRAGFVLCDSLDVAAQILTREGDDGSPIAAKDRVRDLVAYSVSEPYLRLRKAVGLAR
jgi:tetratricopeptide (TPR) repeat protein